MNWLWRALLGDTPMPQCGVAHDDDFEGKLDRHSSGTSAETDAKPRQNKIR